MNTVTVTVKITVTVSLVSVLGVDDNILITNYLALLVFFFVRKRQH